jgi:acetyl esterase/lipase
MYHFGLAPMLGRRCTIKDGHGTKREKPLRSREVAIGPKTEHGTTDTGRTQITLCLPFNSYRTYNPGMSTPLKVTRRTLLGMGGAAALLSPLGAYGEPAQATSAAAVKVEKDVVIGKAGDIDLHCDIYKPVAGAQKRMALIHLHGGGFARGSKDTLTAKLTPITARGYVSIAAQYRLTGVAKWPAQIDDVKNAIRWTREHADSLGIDPQRIATVGYSAGGHLALFAAGADDTHLAACIAFYPAVELNKQLAETLLGTSDEAAMRAASPLTYVKAGFPPTVIFHGLSDVTVPPESSERLMHAIRGAGVSTELHTFTGVPHEFDTHPEFAEACAPLSDFFLDRLVLNPRTYPPFGPGGGAARPGL